MNLEKQPSKFCPAFCSFVKARSFECQLYTDCWHLKDKEVPPHALDVTINGVSHRVTIIGENDVHKPIWYLEEGSLPQMLPKNYDIFSLPVNRETVPPEKVDYSKNKKYRQHSPRHNR